MTSCVVLLFSCETRNVSGTMFKDDVDFLKRFTDVIILSVDEHAQIAVSPDMQGRVMTSTATGANGLSYGWINRELFESGENNKHINAFGGEDRFWLGPEGGQFSIFFKKGEPFDLEHWWTPAPINEGSYDVVDQSAAHVRFNKNMQLENYSGTRFDVELNRTVRLLSDEQTAARFGYPFADVDMVAFESENIITNRGENAWDKETGMLSIWILGMYNPSPATTIVIPFIAGPESQLGPPVNDAYFGNVPQDRLVVKEDILFFRGDGEYRSKIGISPYRAKDILGSYDATNKVLTLVTYNKPDQVYDYVNSMWEIQQEPFAGDVVNSYNDGPPVPGAKPMGPFYELETSSPAAALAPGESLTHRHTTVHIQADEPVLSQIAESILGVSIEDIKAAFSVED
ncbi:hypothetical protein EH223_09950 [candidate division KSB1 bacterium]|nr:hypothetical protein [candidate division KSB1 bacterium]RQW03449.1 MAG: hypothetical protein EH223_09950 [candidate division KSB1 bacterium]